MLKKILFSIFILALSIAIIIVVIPSGDKGIVEAEEYRGGFNLTPEQNDSTGISISSSFILKSKMLISLEEITEWFSIDEQADPIITVLTENSFKIELSQDLEVNKLYIFRIKGVDASDITWAFQTRANFTVLGSLPGHQTTGVPVNSGIEIYLSHLEYDDLDEYFEIEPAVKGSFERHKYTYVFVPEKLEEGTLYTVTLKKGAGIQDSGNVLQEDYLFQFETAVSEEDNKKYSSVSFYFNKVLNEYTPTEMPYIPLYYYAYGDKYELDNLNVKAEIYKYRSTEQFLESISVKAEIPNWAYMTYIQNSSLPIENLDKVQEFEQSFPVKDKDEEDNYLRLPDSLEKGFYLINCTYEDISFQTLIQVTDLGMYMIEDDEQMILWLNSMQNGTPIVGANISLSINNDEYTSDTDGLSNIDISGLNELDEIPYLIIENGNDTALLRIPYSYNYFPVYRYGYGWGTTENSMYWKYLQLDRNLYKPEDSVSLWGFIQNRYEDEDFSMLTVEVSQGYNYGPWFDYGMDCCFPFFSSEPMLTKEIEVKNGAFEGSIDLAGITPGSYSVTIKHGDEVISSSWISVENYVKPMYKLEIEKDKEAIFANESVNFDIKAAFFEGTGLPNLSLDYRLDSYYSNENINGQGITNENGVANITYSPSINDEAQGEISGYLYAYATLPEIGQISKEERVRIFVNDINVNIDASIIEDEDTKKRAGTIEVEVNQIDLDRINSGEAENSSDYLGNVLNNQEIKGSLYIRKWNRIEDGTYYDYINKETVKRYRYEKEIIELANFTMTTNAEGKAVYEFDAPEIENGYYYVELTCVDGNGRTMDFTRYIYSAYRYYYNESDFYQNDNRLWLEADKEKYLINDDVNITYKKGNEAAPVGKYLYIKSQNGIKAYSVIDGPDYNFNFDESEKPNLYINSVYFEEGKYRVSETLNVQYDFSEKELFIEATLDKESYKPGDTAKLILKATDINGNPVSSFVNISIVDEALFYLSDQTVEVIQSLYSLVPSGIINSYSSHINSGNDIDYGWDYRYKNEMLTDDAMAPEAEEGMGQSEDEDIDLREVFKDTAYFKTIVTDSSGNATVNIELPDNITAWRITLAGISLDLNAGSKTQELLVSMPFFINYSMNSTYLTGDTPNVGVTAYGDSLDGSEEIEITVYSSNDVNNKTIVIGKPFERINIAVSGFDTDTEDIIIEARTNDGYTDGIKHYIQVVDTYHEVEYSKYFDADPGMELPVGPSGNTVFYFTDQGRGRYMPSISSYLYTSGNRIEQKLSQQMAVGYMNKYFEREDKIEVDDSFEASEYQMYDGGIAILPYGSSDLDLSARLTPLLKDQVDQYKLKKYFYDTFSNTSIPGVKAAALYGLAVLREPVLLEIDRIAKTNNMSVKDAVYVSLAYYELGESSKALKVYEDKVEPAIEDYDKYSRVNVGEDTDDIIETTSIAAVLSAQLNMENSQSLIDYVINTRAEDIIVSTDILRYIGYEIEKLEPTQGKVIYSYLDVETTIDLSNYWIQSVEIVSSQIDNFEIVSIEGDVGVVSVYKAPQEVLSTPDENLSVTRTYYRYNDPKTPTNEFKQDDIVIVELQYNISSKAIDYSYSLTDYLPSGLKPIENTWRYGENSWYGRIDGQKISFYASKWNSKNGDGVIRYYARVISTGTFKADFAILQGSQNKASINKSDEDIIVIK